MGIQTLQWFRRKKFIFLLCYVAVLFFHKQSFPSLTLPWIVYPMAFGTRMLKYLHYVTGYECVNPAFICECFSLGSFSLISLSYTEMFEGDVLRIKSSAAKPKKIIIWIAGGSFNYADAKYYVSFGQQISGAVLESEVFLVGCRGKSRTQSVFPHVHEQCSSLVTSLIAEVAPTRLQRTKNKLQGNGKEASPELILGADDTGAHLLLSIIQYINVQYGQFLDIKSLLLVSPITHLHHTNYPSTKFHKYPEPIFYFHYSAIINQWLQYLLGTQHQNLARLLQSSQHIAANIRFNSPDFLTLSKSGHDLVRQREFRQSFYFDPVAIRIFDKFIRDPYVGLVFNSTQFLNSITNIEKFEIITLMHSAIRDDALIFANFLQNIKLNGNNIAISNQEFHAAFTGCLRFSNLFNSCPELIAHIIKVIQAV